MGDVIEHPLVVAAALAEVVLREQQWLCLAVRNYPRPRVERFMQYSAEKIQWALHDHGLPKLPVRLQVVLEDNGQLDCLVQIVWEAAGVRGQHVKGAIHRLYAPTMRA